MPTVHYIAMDTHSYSTEVCVKTQVNRPGRQWHLPTTVPALRQVIEAVRRPRYLTFEEGPLAGWLYRQLKDSVDQILVCDPRKNAWVAHGGDKDDVRDAAKLADLFIGGYLKAVHQPETLARETFKQLVGLYHNRVTHRVAEANKIIGQLRRWGVVVKESAFAAAADRPELLTRLGAEPELAVVRANVELLWAGYDHAVRQQERLAAELIRQAKTQEVIVRLTALPGIGWIRAATFVAYVDTPWRFPSKQALWKYLGIGLVRAQSGCGPGFLRVERAANRVLKAMILGAAESALRQGDNPFARQHAGWLQTGLSARNARRNVARSLAAVCWGMWKNGGGYEASRVGVAVTERGSTEGPESDR